MILENVIEEHAEEAAFLWQQREMAVRAPDFDLSDIIEWDERVDAHLDGLRIAGEAGWQIGKDVGWDLPGEYFTAMAQAIQHGQASWIKEVMDAAEGDPDATRGIIAAFAWTPAKELRGLVRKLLETKNPYGRQLGIAACAAHRVNPGEALVTALSSTHAGEKSRALRAVGELGLLDHASMLDPHLEDPDEEIRFWAAWSASLLGNDSGKRVLELFAITDCRRRRTALELMLRALPGDEGKTWIHDHLRGKDQLRWALLAAGLQGDADYLEPLHRQFENDNVARVAGEAFEMITGLNMFELSLEVLEEVEVVPEPTEEEIEAMDVDDLDDDDEDDTEDLGEDEGLVVPDSEKMRAWLDEHGNEFAAGTRLFCGAAVSDEQARHVLLTGRQRQRRIAALDQALASPGILLFEVRAPGRRQSRALAGTS